MKKTLIALLTLLLAAVLTVSLVACGSESDSKKPGKDGTQPTTKAEEPLPPKQDPVSQYTAEGFAPSTLKNQVSWEGLNQFKITKEIALLYQTDPQAAIAEARQITVDFFNYAKTATWIPAEDWNFTHHSDGTSPDMMEGGQVYGGLPYVGLGAGPIYRLMDFIDPTTGVVDITRAGGENHELQKMFGNQCAQGAYQGWCRFINSAKYQGTPAMTLKNKFIPLGDYTYNTDINKWSSGYNTKDVVAENTEQTIYESYALMQPGDGVVNYTTAGHVMMIVSDPVIVRRPDGTIDGKQSYVYRTDQHVQFEEYTHPDGGDQCMAARFVNVKSTFFGLWNSGYIPFTFQEWTGEDPIEIPEYKFHHEGDSIKLEEIYGKKITSNYHIYDIYATVYDAAGNEVLKIGTHSDYASEYELAFMREGTQAVIWGNIHSLRVGGKYTVTISMQSGTGERPVLWEGKLIVE